MMNFFKIIGLYKPTDEEKCVALKEEFQEAVKSPLMKNYELQTTGNREYKIHVTASSPTVTSAIRYDKKHHAMQAYIDIYKNEIYAKKDEYTQSVAS